MPLFLCILGSLVFSIRWIFYSSCCLTVCVFKSKFFCLCRVPLSLYQHGLDMNLILSAAVPYYRHRFNFCPSFSHFMSGRDEKKIHPLHLVSRLLNIKKINAVSEFVNTQTFEEIRSCKSNCLFLCVQEMSITAVLWIVKQCGMESAKLNTDSLW